MLRFSKFKKSDRKAKKKKAVTIAVSNPSGFGTLSNLAIALDGIYFLSRLFSLQDSKFLEDRDYDYMSCVPLPLSTTCIFLLLYYF